MSDSIRDIARHLKTARRHAGLNQRQVADKAGLMQNQVSRMENGAIDPRFSSLLALARALGLEPVLVPRRLVPVVHSLVDTAEPPRPAGDRNGALGILLRLRRQVERFLRAYPQDEDLARLVHHLRDLERLPGALPASRTLSKLLRGIEEAGDGDLHWLPDVAAQVARWRSQRMHHDSEGMATQQSAYRLDEDEDDG